MSLVPTVMESTMVSEKKDCAHEPTKEINRFEDAVMGQRYVRRDWDTMDKFFEDIICKHCGKHIYAPGLINPSTGPGKWIVYPKERP